MKTVKLFSLFLILLSLFVLMTGCASMYIHGSTPVQRAVSAAELLIEGNVSDDYIRVYKTEFSQAERSIMDMISKAERNDIYYADIADNISDWMLLYSRVSTLQRMYPEGLWGKRKKEFVVFEARDYSSLKDTAYTRATEALYNEALRIVQMSGNNSKNISKALAHLKRAKKYSRHLDNEINSLGADIAYNAAETLAYTSKPDNLLQASEYYMLAHSWVPGYRGALEKGRLAKEKAAYLYIEEGTYNLKLKDYTAYRHAKASFQKAEKIIPGIALKEIAEVNRRLTVRLVIVRPDNSYHDEDRIRRAIASELASAKSGPEAIEINFIRGGMSSIFNIIDIRDADLVLTPSDNYGKVKESYGPVNTSNKNVSKTINGILYTGTVTEQSQLVTVYAQNDFVLYDIRTWRKTELRYFNNETNKLSKNFTVRYYSGAPEAKPADFNPGFLYEAGQYKKFFPELMSKNNSMNLISGYGSLSANGKELCNVIKNLQYIERR